MSANRIVSNQTNNAFGTAQGPRSIQGVGYNDSKGYGTANEGPAHYSFSDNVLWTPTQVLSDVRGWWDASVTSSITDSGGNVSQWDDLSGNDRHLTQSEGSKQPITGSATINNRNVMLSAGLGILENMTFPLQSGRSVSIFIICSIDEITSIFDSIFSMNAGSDDFQFASGNASQFNGNVSFENNPAISLTGGPYSGIHMFNLVLDSVANTGKAYVNGSNKGETTYNNNLAGNQEFRVFSNRAGNTGPSGKYGEVIVLDDVTDVTRQTTEGYLAWKWGRVSQLPSDHPYKTYAPGV